jgi:hypothetical protein
MGKKKECDLKKHFEAILGAEIELDFPGEILLRESVATYTEVSDGRLTSREIGTTGNSTKACARARILDVSGRARTSDDGTAELMLSDFFCGSRDFTAPAVFVATPRAQSPVFVTAQASLTGDRKDVRIKIATWKVSGSPAPNLSFNWMCRVPTIIVVD